MATGGLRAQRDSFCSRNRPSALSSKPSRKSSQCKEGNTELDLLQPWSLLYKLVLAGAMLLLRYVRYVEWKD